MEILDSLAGLAGSLGTQATAAITDPVADVFDKLVKFCSFGTAGVSVLAIFLAYVSISRLSKDDPPVKAELIKRYMNTCVIVAIICTVSGVTSSIFNRGKINQAESRTARVVAGYSTQMQKLDLEKQAITENLDSIKAAVRRNPHAFAPALTAQLDSAAVKVNGLHLRPKEELLKDTTR